MNAQRMIELLLPINEAANGAACNNCMKPSKNLVLCAGCKRVAYCNQACQKNNWKKHKPVCKILKVYEEASKGIPDPETTVTTKRHGIPAKFHTFQKLVEVMSNDPLMKDVAQSSKESWQLAKNVVTHSPFCAICFKHQYQEEKETSDGDDSNPPIIPETKWKCCSKCNYGWCCAEHFKEYKPSHTPEICQKYKQATDLDRFRYNHTINHGDRFMFLPEEILSSPMPRFPKNWKEYFQRRCNSCYSAKHQLPHEFFPASTFLLSQVATIMYGMYQHDKHHFTTLTDLTIHIIGAHSNFECEGGAPTCIWEEIMHCLPSVKTMKVIFIGPECGTSFPHAEIGSCPDCQLKGRTRMQAIYETTYQEHFASQNFAKPDFAVAFNTGMYDEDTDSWKENLNLLLDLNVPCIFTSYDENEGNADFDVLRGVNARTLTDGSVKNPFAVDFPAVDFSEVDKFFHCNMYCTCFQGRDM